MIILTGRLLATLASEHEKRHITRMDQERIALLEQAAELLGGGRALARALGVAERSVRAWLAGERGISDGVLADTEKALLAHSEKCGRLAVKIRIGQTFPR